ncbi:MAG: hypothetical protein ABEJ43_03515 [Haloferacaceae archaeon]
MTTVLCGVAGDTGNVRPVPAVDEAGRVEYVPIPEKGPTSETATYGSIPHRYGEGVLADRLTGVRPNSEGAWLDGEALRAQPVHHDPNLDALTYGEHRPGYVAALRALEPGDAVGFYAGFPTPESDYKHRHLFAWFEVAEPPTVLSPDDSEARIESLLAAHPENAHAKRHAANGALYYHDPAFTDRPRDVVVVSGARGGLLDRVVRLSDARDGPNYYMDEAVAETLDPVRRTDRGVHLGGIKPAVECDVTAERFAAFATD